MPTPRLQALNPCHLEQLSNPAFIIDITYGLHRHDATPPAKAHPALSGLAVNNLINSVAGTTLRPVLAEPRSFGYGLPPDAQTFLHNLVDNVAAADAAQSSVCR